MTKLVRHSFYIVLVALFVIQCIDPFEPKVPFRDQDILVVDGYINAGPGESIFQLSRVTPVWGNQQMVFETGASVSIISSDDLIFSLTETAPGRYSSGELNLPSSNEYRLRILLPNNKEYLSAFTPVKITPPIDSIHWEWSRELGTQIYVNAHDSLSQTHYYQWQFQEDWQIRSPYLSLLTYANDTILERDPQEQLAMYNCWNTSKSSDLIFTSSDNTRVDHVKFNLVTIPPGGQRTMVKYSIIVKQHTLSDGNYNYLNLMVKNSTDVGSWFDPMPTELQGNIANVADANEIVVGYVGSYTTEETIFFIDNNDIPFVDTRPRCVTDEFEITKNNLQTFLGGTSNFVPLETFYEVVNGLPVPKVKVIERSCVDCRVYGNNNRPTHWD